MLYDVTKVETTDVAQCRSAIGCFNEAFLAPSSPRYIHRYLSTKDVPYLIDTSTDPCRGSYGTVRKVKNKIATEEFAVKMFEDVRPSQRNKILREVGVLELCLHRNIVQLVEAFEVDDVPDSIHIVMAPWAPYTLLKFLQNSDHLRKARCPWFEPDTLTSDQCIYRVLLELADGVGYLHESSIKHKDIKPDNILLYQPESKSVIPIIADVGVSKVYSIGAGTDYIGSTYSYLSPEQLSSRESSLKSDIWQLGCCFAMLLAVARGGTSALDTLWSSFSKTDEHRSCNIAMEISSFMETLRGICLPGNRAQKHIYKVVIMMLDQDPATRLEIGVVRTEIQKLFPCGRNAKESSW